MLLARVLGFAPRLASGRSKCTAAAVQLLAIVQQMVLLVSRWLLIKLLLAVDLVLHKL